LLFNCFSASSTSMNDTVTTRRYGGDHMYLSTQGSVHAIPHREVSEHG
jgi:hypothetical protein